MAKKKASGGFNMSAEIRKLLRARRTITGREVYNALVENFPNQKINENSCLVGFSKARMRLGLKKKGTKKKSLTSCLQYATANESTTNLARNLLDVKLFPQPLPKRAFC